MRYLEQFKEDPKQFNRNMVKLTYGNLRRT